MSSTRKAASCRRRSMMAGSGSRVLSIQSSVVSGYVGNKSAVFPLQLLGFDVSMINSVQLSNHTGYNHFKGQVLCAAEIGDLYDGLRLNKINNFSHILTGYIGSKSFLKKVHDIILELKQNNPDLIYVCDPVMGDNGKLYVPADLLSVYQEDLVPLADIIVPNQFEAELLTGVQINTQEDALKAMDNLHARGSKIVVLSSSNLGQEDVLMTLASTHSGGLKECYKMEVPYIPAIFVGTGDLFAALLLAWLHKDGKLKVALEKAMSTVQAVIKKTMAHAQELAGPGQTPTAEQMELLVIQSKAEIENPTISIHTEVVQ